METSTESTSAVTTDTPTISANNLVLIHEATLNCNGQIIKEQIFKDPSKDNIKLFRDGVDLTANINNAFSAYVYDKEYWGYKDSNKYVHLFKDSKELTVNVKTLGILRHPQTGQWIYADDKNKLALIPA